MERFDTYTASLANEYPGVIGYPDDSEASQNLWGLLRQEKRSKHSRTDPKVMREAAEWVKSSGVGSVRALVLDNDAIPF